MINVIFSSPSQKAK